MPRPLLYCLTVFVGLLWSNLAPAQSLFYETLKIKKILNQRSQPTIYTSDSLTGWEVRFEDRLLSQTDTLRLTEIGRYSLKRTSSARDTLQLRYGSAGKTVVVPQIIQIDNVPNEVAWTLRSATVRLAGSGGVQLSKTDSLPWEVRENMQSLSNGVNETEFMLNNTGRYNVRAPASFELTYNDSTFTIDLPKSYRLVIELSDSEVSFHQVSDFRVGRLSKPDFYELMTFLAIHSEYQESTFGMSTLENVYKKYRDNPFLAPLLDTLLYSYNFEELAPYLDFNETEFGHQVEEEIKDNYSWLTAMYDNPALDAKKQILEEKDVSYYAKLDPNDKSSAQRLQNASQRANAAYTKVSGFDQTSIIVGLSDFIAERAQEELNITFMDRFKRRLTDDEPNEFSVLFPNTYDLFLQFEIANYKKLLQNARPIFANDLQNLGLHLPNLLKLDKYKNLLNYSTEVYNLALFYEVTRLIYNEQPIEDILVTSYQQMRRRSQDMNEIINLQLADTILQMKTFAVADSTARKKSPTNSLKQLYQPLPTKVTGYTEKVQTTYGDLEKATVLLKGYLDNLLTQMDSKSAPRLYQRTQDLRSRLGSQDGKITARFNYNVPKIQAPKKAFDYFRHYAGNNLLGKGYFGYYLEEKGGDFTDYENFFSEDLTEKAYVARGLELTRLMVEENFDSILTDWRGLLAEISPQARQIQEQIILRRRANLDTLVTQVNALRTAVEAGINDELNTWESHGLSDSTNIDLAALRYLNKLINNQTQELWLTLSEIEQALGDPSFFPMFLEASGLSTNDVLQLRADGDREIRRVYQQCMDRIAKLTKQNPQFARPDNAGFDHYNAVRLQAVSFDPSEFTNLTTVDNLLATSVNQMQEIATDKDDLKSNLIRLDRYYAPDNLTKARRTSSDLATALEFSVHLLYSLKKEVVEVRPALQDTTTAQYTIVTRDMGGRVDSSVVINKPLIRPDTIGNARQQVDWLKKESFDSLMLDPQGRAIFLGLLYQQLKSLKRSPDLSAEGLATLTTKLINTIYGIQSDRNALDKKKLGSDRISFKDYYPFIQTTVDLFSTVVETPIYKDTSLAQRVPTLGSVTKVAQQGLSLYKNIDDQQYGYAIYNAMEIFRVISEAEARRRAEMGKENLHSDRIRNLVILYGTFMADVINARSPEQVKEALRAAASPPGTSRLKRELVYNVSVNGYLGPGFGIERLRSSKVAKPTIGLSVPVGLAFSWKWNKSDKNSFSFFVPVLDIGAVTYFRLNDENSNNLPELSFSNFIAPGAFLYYNVNNSPFTFGGGWQYGPQIRGTSLTDPDANSSASRFVLFAGIDVPLFNLANGPMGIPRNKKDKKDKKGRKNKKPTY